MNKRYEYIFWALEYRGLFNWMSDEKYLKLRYRMSLGQKLNLNNPQTFNEKLQWLKIHDHNPLYTTLVDKYAVKEYIKEKLGERYVIPLIGGPWKNAKEIDFDMLPAQFVLKCTHDSGGIVICRDKSTFDKKAAQKKLNKCLMRNFYYGGREWPYKNVKPQIIAEKYMKDELVDELMDYKLMCFNSKVKATFVCSDRFSDSGLKMTFYDTHWRKMPFEGRYPASSVEIKKPNTYEQMVAIAEKLSAQMPFVRIDFYEIQNKTYFGEFTFYPSSGFLKFNPDSWDLELGKWIELSKQKFE